MDSGIATQSNRDDLRNERDRFVAFAFSVADAFVELDASNKVVYAAGAAKALAGHESDDLIGRNFQDLISPDDHELLQSAHATAQQQGRCGPLHLRMIQGNGKTLRLEVRGANLPEHSDGLFLSFIQDDGPAAAKPINEKSGIKPVTFAANEIVFDENSPADTAYILRKGAVDIRIGTRTSNPNTLITIETGEVFGELALLENRAHTAAAIATTKCEALALPRAEFIKRLNATDLVMKTLIQHLIRGVRETTAKYDDLRKVNWS